MSEVFGARYQELVLLLTGAIPSGDSLEDESFAGYIFSGNLRPARKTPMRTLPDSIKRPDYAESGIPYSERKAKDDRDILTLNDEEIEGMRLTGRVSCRIFFIFRII
ncbi:unnamed protein product [Echinostoma caproni]|uniref:Peptidylprolyl isomerase n=1 Tax=Echinostoma caproni TaxID=27848 RepID=A0A183BDM4_9TREM|nr:unnamed protein product [Echinostoma caproni]